MDRAMSGSYCIVLITYESGKSPVKSYYSDIPGPVPRKGETVNLHAHSDRVILRDATVVDVFHTIDVGDDANVATTFVVIERLRT
jgi:hypothetical protein